MTPVTFGELNQAEAKIMMAAAAWLPTYISAGSNFRQLCRDGFVSGSPAEAVKALGFETGDEQAALRGAVADDFLMGTSQLVGSTEGVTNFTLYAAIRGALEADAMICWLLQPGLPALLCGARILSLRLRHQKLNGKFVPLKTFAAERRKVIYDKAAGLGLTVNGGAVGGERPPTTTMLVKTLLPDIGEDTEMELGGVLFHVLAGMTHGEEWSSLLGKATPRTGTGSETLAVDLNVRNFLLSLVHVLELHERAIRCYGTHFGVETSARPTIISLPWVRDVIVLYSANLTA